VLWLRGSVTAEIITGGISRNPLPLRKSAKNFLASLCILIAYFKNCDSNLAPYSSISF